MKIRLNKVDILFSRLIRLRAKGLCEYCGGWVGYPKLAVSHYFGRRNGNTRFDEENCQALCFFCHMTLTENPHEYYEWMRKRLGEDAYNMLAVRASIVCKPDMEAVLLYLKGKLKEVGDEL